MMTIIALLVPLSSGRTHLFPPGWNQLAATPPLGWRSWNAFGARVSQDIMVDAIDALVAKEWLIEGIENSSLLAAGYTMIGVDEGWEACGAGTPPSRQHDAHGNPTINSKFPNLTALVEHAHERGLRIGFYENGCACGEHVELARNYEGDVRALGRFGFDGVKLDNCGVQKNLTRYAELMQASGKAFYTEACHWGLCADDDTSSCPTSEWCPYNWYRTSGDINSSPMSWLHNLQSVRKFTNRSLPAPLSVPHCWAYPDMLEVGRITIDGEMHEPWNRAHFGGWCVVSAPLILGLELTRSQLAPIIPIITNKEAIDVNQAWAGHPGDLVWEGAAPPVPSSLGFVGAERFNTSVPGGRCGGAGQAGWALTPLLASSSSAPQMVRIHAPGGGCLTTAVAGRRSLMITPCNNGTSTGSSKKTQEWQYTPSINGSAARLFSPLAKGCVDIDSHSLRVVQTYACNGGPSQNITFGEEYATMLDTDLKGGFCLGRESSDPDPLISTTLQAWAKPLDAATGAVAVLLLNPDALFNHTITLPLAQLPSSSSVLVADGDRAIMTSRGWRVRDIWARKDLPPIKAGVKNLTAVVGPLDSVFVKLTPI